MARKSKPRRRMIKGAPKECYFCKEKKQPSFEDIGTLQRFLTERSKIMPRARTGLCAKHQKEIKLNTKYARHLALLPFLVRG